MPYASDKQRRFMWSQHPDIAEKFAEEGHGNVKGKDKKSKHKLDGLKKAKPKSKDEDKD